MVSEVKDNAPPETGFAAPDTVAPVAASGDRISSLDLIRGIAVLGILAANIVAFGQPFSAYMWPEAFLTDHGSTSEKLWIAQFVLIDGKMRALFTLLFGAGMMLFMEKAWARGATRKLQVRRLLFLMLFGLLHYFLLWKGDILTSYALVGLIALIFVKIKAKTQLMFGICGYVAGAILYAAMMLPLHFIADTPFGQSPEMVELNKSLNEGIKEATADDNIETAIITSGDYFGYVGHNFSEHSFDVFATTGLFGFEMLPLMLIGMALYRMGLFTGQFNRKSQRFWGWTGLIVGGGLTYLIALWAADTGFTYYGTLAAFVGAAPIPRLIMALGLIALLAQWAPRITGWLGQRLSAAGRMAFTNYLGTSLAMIIVFHGWGFGLFGELTRPQLYLVVLGTWALMLLWSKPWLERYRYGPLEWLWRCLTYGRRFPIKR